MRTLLVTVSCALSAGALASDCTRTSTGLVPLNDLGPGLYLGQFQGGLYPGGLNTPPLSHHLAARSRAAQIVPRAASGQPSPGGKIVLLSIGMSNCTQEFCGGSFPNCQSFSFIGQAAANPAVNHATLAIVDGASGGQTPQYWDSPTDANYDLVRDQRLPRVGATEAQVQAIWIKEANASPRVSLPDPGADAYALETGLANVVRAAKMRYPNLQLVFISSRIYAGYATSGLNPEPYAYESGFSVKWLIQAQITQRETGAIDPVAGDLADAAAPAIVWGPYLWADGTTPRGDGLTWVCSDFNPSDGTHPATGARTKVGAALVEHLLASPYADWFRAYCPGDFNRSGGSPDDADTAAFFHAWRDGNPAADINASGGTPDDADVMAFFQHWEEGC